MRVDLCLGRRVDDRADIRHKIHRIIDVQCVHRAVKHRQEALCDVLLQIEHPHGAAALPGRLERGCDNVANRLFRQRGAVHDHCV